MILVDVNLLVYATMPQLPQHSIAREWLDERLSGTDRIGLPWTSLVGFLRVVTNPQAFRNPPNARQAWSAVESWLDCPNVWVPEAGAKHRSILAGLIPHLGGGHRLIHDAHLAALAIEHGLTLCSSDGDFARFPGLRWHNPITT